jgi:hypothetical protein
MIFGEHTNFIERLGKKKRMNRQQKQQRPQQKQQRPHRLPVSNNTDQHKTAAATTNLAAAHHKRVLLALLGAQQGWRRSATYVYVGAQQQTNLR